METLNADAKEVPNKRTNSSGNDYTSCSDGGYRYSNKSDSGKTSSTYFDTGKGHSFYDNKEKGYSRHENQNKGTSSTKGNVYMNWQFEGGFCSAFHEADKVVVTTKYNDNISKEEYWEFCEPLTNDGEFHGFLTNSWEFHKLHPMTAASEWPP